MIDTFNYQTLWDTFTIAASPVVANAAFDSIRASLNGGHVVEIVLNDNQQPLSFTRIDEFEQWVSTFE